MVALLLILKRILRESYHILLSDPSTYNLLPHLCPNHIPPPSVNFLLKSILIFDPLNLSLTPIPAKDIVAKSAPYTPPVYPSLALTPTSHIPFKPKPLALPANLINISSTASSVMSFYVGETRNCLSTRMNGQCSSMKVHTILPFQSPFTLNLNNSL